jgi:hypothetical protein
MTRNTRDARMVTYNLITIDDAEKTKFLFMTTADKLLRFSFGETVFDMEYAKKAIVAVVKYAIQKNLSPEIYMRRSDCDLMGDFVYGCIMGTMSYFNARNMKATVIRVGDKMFSELVEDLRIARVEIDNLESK